MTLRQLGAITDPGGHGISCAARTPAVVEYHAAGERFPRALDEPLHAGPPKYPLDPAWCERVPEMEAALLLAINADRKAHGLPPVVRDPLLDVIAYWAAAQRGWALYLDHTDHIPDAQLGNTTGAQVDRPFGARFWDYGYPSAAIGENLAYGFPTAVGVEAAFMSDQGHRDNILNGSYVGVGLGCARTTMNCAPGLTPMPGIIWTAQDFGGAPVGPAPHPDPDPDPQPDTHTHPKVGETWVRKTNQRATVHVDAVFVKRGVTKVTYTNLQGSQPTTTETRFLELFKFLRAA